MQSIHATHPNHKSWYLVSLVARFDRVSSDTGHRFVTVKCSKTLITFLFLFSNKIMLTRAGIHKMLVRIANREDPDQTASEEAV